MEEAKELLYIIRNYIRNEKYNTFENADEEKLYKLAKANMMSNFLYDWSKENCKSNDINKMIQDDYNMQIIRDTNQNLAIENILNEFEKNNIKLLIVKGSIIKNIYPQNYMRQMGDIDILVDEKDFKQAEKIMKNLGYGAFYNYEKHLIFTKEPLITVELHRKLVLKKDTGYEHFKNVWPLCMKHKDYNNIYQLNFDEAYVFTIIHLLIHFKFTGIEIRDILDIYIYNEKYKNVLDYNKLGNIFNEIGVAEFEKNIKNISYRWFGTSEIDDFDEVEKFILQGASLNNSVNYHIGQENGKGNYIFRLFFPSFKIMEEKYPVLKKAPILLPAMWVARIFKDIFAKESTVKTRLDTIKLIQNASDDDIKNIQEIYKKLGI